MTQVNSLAPPKAKTELTLHLLCVSFMEQGIEFLADESRAFLIKEMSLGGQGTIFGNYVHFLLKSKASLLTIEKNFFGKVSKTTLLEVPSLGQGH